MLVWTLATLLYAGEWADGEIDPKVLTDVTAYTPGKKLWTLGVVNQDYGLLSNLSVGTRAPLWALGVYNGNAKITAVQTPKFDASLSAELMGRRLDDVNVQVVPVAWTGSWLTTKRLSLHFGHSWTMAAVDGQMTASGLAAGLEEVLGIDIADDLQAALGDTDVYAGASVTLLEARLAADYRFNRRDSLVITARSFVAAYGLAGGGAEVEVDEVDELQIGTTARFRTALGESLPALVTVSWQFSWERLHLRVGIPLTRGAPALFALPQAFRLYWVLGPLGGPSAQAAPPVGIEEADLTP